MKYELDNTVYDVQIIRKNNKNIYIRVKEDLNIYITCNYLTSERTIKKLLDDNIEPLRKMLSKAKSLEYRNSKFFYLGKAYDIIISSNIKSVLLSEDKIYAKDMKTLDKWYHEEIVRIFDERYVYVYNRFKEDIKSPILKIRTMKTRWGVYNRKNHTITLNSKLIGYDIEKIDYVIIHELSHIIHFDHSKAFWNLVGKYCPNYKIIRKEMRE